MAKKNPISKGSKVPKNPRKISYGQKLTKKDKFNGLTPNS